MSVVQTLQSDCPTKIADKRLSIETASMRQDLWRRRGDNGKADPLYADAKPEQHEATDLLKWVDTDIMLCDPLTKAMEAEKLVEFVSSNSWSTAQPSESMLRKRAKQAARRSQSDGSHEPMATA
jgi:hypothetical protein